MNIIQCTFCKKPFQSLGGRICPACHEQIDKDFIKVRDYIYENKNAHLDKVSEETEVSKQIIMHLLREGRLILDNPESSGVLNCEVCKKPISTGRMCRECKEKFAVKMQSSVDSKKPPGSDRTPPGGRGTAKI